MGRRINYEERDRIKKMATLLFFEHGYENVSTRSIAETCNITRALLHHYYPQKEMLLLDSFLFLVQQYNRYFLERMSEEQFRLLDVELFFRLFFGMCTIDQKYKNLFLHIYSNVELLNKFIGRIIDEHFALLIEKPHKEEKQYAMYAIAGTLSQFIMLQEKKLLPWSTEELVDYAVRGYYLYIGKTPIEADTYMKTCKSVIDEPCIKNFISEFEEGINNVDFICSKE